MQVNLFFFSKCFILFLFLNYLFSFYIFYDFINYQLFINSWTPLPPDYGKPELNYQFTFSFSLDTFISVEYWQLCLFSSSFSSIRQVDYQPVSLPFLKEPYVYLERKTNTILLNTNVGLKVQSLYEFTLGSIFYRKETS